MRFTDIPGIEETKVQLIQAARNGKNAHAQLFAGKPGAPNLEMALAYATYLNCENPGASDACGACASCSKNLKYIHPDLHFVFPVSATKKIKGKDVISQSFLKEWREFLLNNSSHSVEEWAMAFGGEDKQLNISKEESRQIIRNLSLKAFEGKFKIMLIWLPEYLHPYAANGILKILEEPPENTVFLLVSNDSEKLLTTILSRTQLVLIRKYDLDELTGILVNQHDVAPDKASRIARLADGELEVALRGLESIDNDQHQVFANWMRLCYDLNKADNLVMEADNFHRMPKLSQRNLLKYGMSIMRECLLIEAVPELSRAENSEQTFVSKFGALLDISKVDRLTNEFNQALYHLERNGSPKMTFMDLSLQIMKILRQ